MTGEDLLDVDPRGAHDRCQDGDKKDGKSSEEEEVLAKRRALKSKLTRAMNRLRESSRDIETVGERRVNRELEEIQKDFTRLCDIHNNLYELSSSTDQKKLEDWEKDLADVVFEFEDEIKDRLSTYKRASSTHMTGADETRRKDVRKERSGRTYANHTCMNSSHETYTNRQEVPSSRQEGIFEVWDDYPGASGNYGQIGPSTRQSASGYGHIRLRRTFDTWIDELIEFHQPSPSERDRDMSVADALYRLEAAKDMPMVKLVVFDGSPLNYVDFVESFKLHIHDKNHMCNDLKMLQLKMHVTGNAQRAISGLGSSGLMYHTALKMLKEQFGSRSVIARASIDRLVKGPKLAASNRQGLRDLSLDMVNCLATLKRIDFESDMNSTESLRQLVRRLPDHMITKWKTHAADQREWGCPPTLELVSNFLRKQVKVCFDPDFGDLDDRESRFDSRNQKDQRKGVSAVQAQPQSTQSPQTSRSRRPLKCRNPTRSLTVRHLQTPQ